MYLGEELQSFIDVLFFSYLEMRGPLRISLLACWRRSPRAMAQGTFFFDWGIDLNGSGFALVDFFLEMLKRSVSKVAYFETSSNRVLTPVEAFEEAESAFDAYDLEPEQSWNAIPHALSRTLASLSSSALNREMLKAPRVSEFKALVVQFEGEFSKLPAKQRKNYLTTNEAELRETLSSARDVVEKMYWDGIIERVLRALSDNRSYASSRDQINRIVPELVTSMIYQGRDVDTFADLVEERIRELQRESVSEAKDVIAHLLRAEREKFAVATVITGAVNAPIPRELGGREIEFPGPISWDDLGRSSYRNGRGGSKQKRRQQTRYQFAASDLAKFCMEHWKVPTEDSNSGHEVQAQVVVWDVKAWDAVQARQIALDRAESLMDRINAEHRVGEFGVKRKVLVWKRGERSTMYLTDVYDGPKRTRVMPEQKSPSVQRSLRFASRASTERAGAMAVFFGWVALEYLGRGNNVQVPSQGARKTLMKPQNFVAKNVPKVVALAAVHHLANEVSFAIRDQAAIEKMPSNLGSVLRLKSKKAPNEHLDQRKLFRILEISNSISTPKVKNLASILNVSDQKARKVVEEFNGLVENMNAVDRYRIRAIRDLLLSPDKMAEYLSGVKEDADIALQRMRFVRNQTAHSTTPESLRYKTLSNASREILDTCYQVINKDLRSNKPHETLNKLAVQFDALVNDLRRGIDEKIFAPHLVLKVSEG